MSTSRRDLIVVASGEQREVGGHKHLDLRYVQLVLSVLDLVPLGELLGGHFVVGVTSGRPIARQMTNKG